VLGTIGALTRQCLSTIAHVDPAVAICRLGIELERWAADDNRRVKQRTRADEVYQAICAVLGASVLFIAIMWRFGPNKSQYGRVMFSIPDPRRNVWHNIITDDALTLDAITFCRDIMAAARTWFSTKQNDPTVQANISAMVQLRPNGRNRSTDWERGRLMFKPN
jgi:hypothetical protein